MLTSTTPGAFSAEYADMRIDNLFLVSCPLLSQFLFSPLRCVASYCARGGVRLVSGVATACPSGGWALVERFADVLLGGTNFKGECCKDCTTLSSMQLEVTSVRHKILRLCNPVLRNLLPGRRMDGRYSAAQPIGDDGKVPRSRGVGLLHIRRTAEVGLGEFDLYEGTC